MSASLDTVRPVTTAYVLSSAVTENHGVNHKPVKHQILYFWKETSENKETAFLLSVQVYYQEANYVKLCAGYCFCYYLQD